MGIEIIKLDHAGESIEDKQVPELASLHFSTHEVPNPQMAIWVMTAQPGLPLMPWYKYQGSYENDIDRLGKQWSVSSDQGLFDCLFLSTLKKIAPMNLYMIFPGNIRTEGWNRLPENSQYAFNRGQGCVYRLEGTYKTKMTINWVPFYQPQSVLRDPTMENLWRLFVAGRSDDASNCISFFSLPNSKDLPLALQLLMGMDDDRSEKLSRVVEWFGIYSSPITPSHGAFATIYAENKEKLVSFTSLETRFKELADQVRSILSSHNEPAAVLSVLSRFAR